MQATIIRGGGTPSSTLFYGSAVYGNTLSYDPTISGAQSGSGGGGGKLSARTSPLLSVATSQSTNTNTEDEDEQLFHHGLTTILAHLNTHPEDFDNYKLLQEAYTLVRLYDKKDSSSVLNKIDLYSESYGAKMKMATVQLNNLDPATSGPSGSAGLTQADKKMGVTSVLLKMDKLLQDGKWEKVQEFAHRFAPFIKNSKEKSSFLAGRAVAWEHQKEFGKALAAYQQIEMLQPSTSNTNSKVVPYYTYQEEALKDSMKVHSQIVRLASSTSSKLVVEKKQLPKKFSLGDSYPNPFNPTSTIPFSLPAAAHVRIEVYNLMGQRVATLTNRQYQAGNFQVPFNGQSRASGIYFIRAWLGNKVFTKRMTLIK